MHSRLLRCNTICSFAPSLNPDRPAIPRKSATFSNCKSAATRRPPSTQLKPISIYLKGEFAAPHGHLTTCIAPSLTPDRSTIPRKSATLSKVGTVSGDPPSAVNATKAYIHLFKRRICRAPRTPDNLYSTIANPRPSCYPAKIRNVIKGRNSQRRPAAYSCSAIL